MERSVWYQKRRHIARQQARLKPAIERIKSDLESYLKSADVDPLTKDPIAALTDEVHGAIGFLITSVTGGTATVTLEERSDHIRVEPALVFAGQRIERIYALDETDPFQPYLLVSQGTADKISLYTFLEQLVDSVLT